MVSHLFSEYFHNSTEIKQNHLRGVFYESHKQFQEMFLRRLRDAME